MDRYVDECATRLWKPEGSALRRWLTRTRGLPRDVLIRNCVGADLGPRIHPRPAAMPRAAGVVLPVLASGRAAYAQILVPRPQSNRPPNPPPHPAPPTTP